MKSSKTLSRRIKYSEMATREQGPRADDDKHARSTATQSVDHQLTLHPGREGHDQFILEPFSQPLPNLKQVSYFSCQMIERGDKRIDST